MTKFIELTEVTIAIRRVRIEVDQASGVAQEHAALPEPAALKLASSSPLRLVVGGRA